MNVLVIDVGTSSMRALLSGARGERLLGHQVAYHPTYLSDGRVEQDASSFASALCEVVGSVARNAGEKGHAVDLVTMTSQRSSIVPVDDADEPLMPFIMWQDTRNAALCDELSKSGEHIFSLSGTRVNTVFSGGKMAWVERELPEVASRCRRYANIPEYLMHLMTGSWHTDPTYASRSNLMNIRTRDWDPELLGLFGVSRDRLSDIVECGQIVGTVSSFFSSATGLAAGTPVVSSGGDQQCAAVGQGVASPGTVSVVTGTGAFLETAAPSVPDDLTSDVICNASCLPGQYTLEASVLSCCSAFDWFRTTFCPDMDYARIGRELEVQHARGTSCVVLPYFQGRGTPDWNAQATATLHGIRLSATREELLYALLVGIFTEVRNNLDSMERYVPLVRGSVSGGLTQTPVINQIQADVYGFPLSRLDDFESTARGALLVALLSQGAYGTAEEAYGALSGDATAEAYEPDPARHGEFLDLQRRSQDLYARLYA